MSLNLNQLLPQLQYLGQHTHQHALKQAAQLPALLEALQQSSLSQADMLEYIHRAGMDWRGAIPTAEPIHQTFPAPALTPRFSILAADGSQVHPDRHAACIFFLLNIGQICIERGSKQAPNTHTHSELFYHETDLYPGDFGLVDNSIINARRDVMEIGALADMAEAGHTRPQLAMLDNSLLLWIALRSPEVPSQLSEPVVADYQKQLDRLRNQRTALAGVIDRPGSSNLVALLQLLGTPLDHVSPDFIRHANKGRLLDRTLLTNWLPVGYRSALFIQSSPVNRDFETLGHQIQFFYLNPGFKDTLLRVEIPAWVAEQPDLLALVHAGILDQCRLTNGFPYALARAHELAVVSQSDRRLLEQSIQQSLLKQGLRPHISQKSRQKSLLSARRSFDIR